MVTERTSWAQLCSELGVDRAHPAYESARRAYELDARPRIEFVKVTIRYGRYVLVPTVLPQLPAERALATVELPLSVNWSDPGRVFRLSDRYDRARVYEIVLQEGNEEEFLRFIDGTLLVDMWDELVLPRAVRAAWSPLINHVRGVADTAMKAEESSGEVLGGDQ
jgi:hypothetical protein